LGLKIAENWNLEFFGTKISWCSLDSFPLSGVDVMLPIFGVFWVKKTLYFSQNFSAKIFLTSVPGFFPRPNSPFMRFLLWKRVLKVHAPNPPHQKNFSHNQLRLNWLAETEYLISFNCRHSNRANLKLNFAYNGLPTCVVNVWTQRM
jgi:hypothetical protein